MNVKFFVESKADRKFITDCVSYFTGNIVDRNDFVELNGSTDNLIEAKKPDFESSTDLGGINLVFLDADSDCAGVKSRLLSIKQRLGIQFEFFVMPNDQDSGALENLLLNLAVDANILNCFDSYTGCLSAHNLGYKTPSNKGKIFAYLDALAKNRKEEELIIEDKRDFLDNSRWDLSKPEIFPLRDFLISHVH